MVYIHPDIDLKTIPANVMALANGFDGIKVKTTIGIVNYASDKLSGFSVDIGVYHDRLLECHEGVTKVVGHYDTNIFAFHFDHSGTRVEYENDSGSIYRDDESIHEGWVE